MYVKLHTAFHKPHFKYMYKSESRSCKLLPQRFRSSGKEMCKFWVQSTSAIDNEWAELVKESRNKELWSWYTTKAGMVVYHREHQNATTWTRLKKKLKKINTHHSGGCTLLCWGTCMASCNPSRRISHCKVGRTAALPNLRDNIPPCAPHKHQQIKPKTESGKIISKKGWIQTVSLQTKTIFCSKNICAANLWISCVVAEVGMGWAIHAKSDSGLTVVVNVTQLLTALSSCPQCSNAITKTLFCMILTNSLFLSLGTTMPLNRRSAYLGPRSKWTNTDG